MKKILFILMILAPTGAPILFAQSAGGGLSFFFPESLLDKSGSVSKEAGLSTNLGFGNGISIPLGFTYIKASGLQAYKDTDDDESLEKLDENIWYIADTFIPYVRAQVHVDLGSLFVEGFGGIAGAWIVAPQAFTGAIGRYYGAEDGVDYYVFSDLESEFSFGFGYQFGAAVGFRSGDISISLEGIFTNLKADTEITATEGWEGGTTPGTISDFSSEFTSRLRGISLGLNGSYAF